MAPDATPTLEPLDEAVDHIRGAAGARVILVYGDYECPYTRLAFREIERLEDELDRVVVGPRRALEVGRADLRVVVEDLEHAAHDAGLVARRSALIYHGQHGIVVTGAGERSPPREQRRVAWRARERAA